MARRNVDIGSGYDTYDGDKLRDGGDKINQNFIDLWDAKNISGNVKFDSPSDGFINSPNAPLSSIAFDMTEAVNGGVVQAYYKGAILTKNSFTGLPSEAVIVLFNGQNVLNELCGVFIVYDKGNNCFSVSIMTGFTGDLPGPPSDAPATGWIVSIEDESSGGDTTAPATGTITEIEEETTGDTTSPATGSITEITDET